MTATSACRIELEALRERLSTLIHELKVAERITDALDVPVVLQIDGREVARSQVRVDAIATAAPIKALPRTDASKASTPTSRVSSPNDAKVVAALTGQGWMRIEAIATRTKLPKGTAYTRLTRLSGHGQVETRTEGRRTLYRLATRRAASSPPLRPGAVAGTQAAPPVGPPSANGRQASSGFEVAWNGTKERNGDAPTILPPRERKP